MKSGFLNVNKPEGWTSHDVVAKLRRILGIKKIGHSGTLDPFASGVLAVAIGSSTRLIRFLSPSKSYLAEIDLSSKTDTDDHTGEKIEDTDLGWSEEEFIERLKPFLGKIEQIPPKYSAIKHEGKRLYKLSRDGKEIDFKDIKKRTVEIFEMDLIDYSYPKAQIKLSCSEGTYIRSIARDLSGHLSRLVRTESNGFDLESAHDIEEIEACENPESLILPSNILLKLASLECNEKETLDLQQGKRILLNNNSLCSEEFIKCIDPSEELIGIASVLSQDSNSYVQPKVIL